MARGAPGRDEAVAQLSALRKLHQQPAALLIGWTARGLRDSDAPRNKDGSYNGTKLVKWALARAAGKRQQAQLDGKELDNQLRQERLREARRQNDEADGRLVVAERAGDIIRDINQQIRDRLADLVKKYGPELAAEIGDITGKAEIEWGKQIKPR